ncbi:MAG: DNA polymerase III subunit chi [Alphaproteobacteria bacterium]|jgi:DNA polymerase-3 subunit chi|uniref:DNA polymerase III subunit chi n=1 Tax=Phenylobacterium sp. TaxID=1871053 RepID=UPI0025CF21B4|nr:DNA polymerase III subunit chi [Phenylobacterium sp.]MCA3712139.1 DNA polymerase III subunit chi [Phenylobacterium sp.]MCA6237303.1 DNA polymerase III subunit chi [Phenylobacterium sp.]MCA6261047.1 DNA polymerase III subunit chi [Phenylobacterium sp.]
MTTCEVWFYHLERQGLDQVLPTLLERTLQKGWRALIRATSAERIEHLDGWLWSYRDDSFLPHAADPGGSPADPVVLTAQAGNPNQAEALFLVDGAEVEDLAGFQRCSVLFDGKDEAALQAARAQWRRFRDAGVSAAYWRQGETGWEKVS